MRFLDFKREKFPHGFSFLELLVVTGFFIILLSVLFITINPSERFRIAKNEERMRDVNKILSAIEEWLIDENNSIEDLNNGRGIPTELKNIGPDEGDVDICKYLVPNYLDSIPFDSDSTGAYFNSCEDYYTGYNIISYTGPRTQIVISAPNSGYRNDIFVSSE